MRTRSCLRRTACAALLVCASTLIHAGCEDRMPPEAATAPPDGAKVFARACAKCHGEDGSGGLPMASGGPKPIDFRHRQWQASRSDAELTAAIRDGRGAMPPFHDVLTPAEIAALTAHVRQLGARSR